MRKLMSGMGLLLWILFLSGCGAAAVPSDDLTQQADPTHLLDQTPPTLHLQIGDDTLRTFRGGYSWSYYDAEEKSMVGVEADTDFPPAWDEVERWRKIDRNAEVDLNFDEAPLSYNVYVWDEAGNRSLYPTRFDLAKHEGKTLFEIFARWEQGQVSYAVFLDIE